MIPTDFIFSLNKFCTLRIDLLCEKTLFNCFSNSLSNIKTLGVGVEVLCFSFFTLTMHFCLYSGCLIVESVLIIEGKLRLVVVYFSSRDNVPLQFSESLQKTGKFKILIQIKLLKTVPILNACDSLEKLLKS